MDTQQSKTTQDSCVQQANHHWNLRHLAIAEWLDQREVEAAIAGIGHGGPLSEYCDEVRT